MEKKLKSSTVSSDVVRYLVSLGYTQKQLAEVLEVDTSYISHVIKGNRNLIVTDLERLAKEEHLTLPELLARAAPIESVPKDLRKGYKLFLKAIKEAEMARSMLAHKPRTRKALAV